MMHPHFAKAKQAIAEERAKNEERLNRSLSFWESFIAQCNVFYAQWANPHDHPALAKEAVQRANEAYRERFPSGLAEKTEEALFNLPEYKRRIADYEARIGIRPYVPFPTDQEWYRLIVHDPLRIEEELFFLDGLLDSRLHPTPKPLRIVDLGTGNGRMVFRISGVLSGLIAEDCFQLIGLDRELVNLRDGAKSASEKGGPSSFCWLAGDMARLPLRAGSCDFILAASCLNLVPEYERPLVILEMLRCLREGGEVIVTGPNERFSAEEYIKCTVASNLERYVLPWNMAQAQSLGQVGTIIDDLVKERLDCSYLPTDAFCETLQVMDCQLQTLEHWPTQGSEPHIFSGMRFKVTAATKQRMQRYERQRRKELTPVLRRQEQTAPLARA
jgi:SAM-dependent methyltransferase